NSYSKSNEYTLTVTYNGNCKAVASTKVEVTGNNVAPFVPNAFTPNGDGMNDVFMVFGEGISKVNMQIFNRWGEKVFESASQTSGWDGTYKGQLQNTGVFVYQITAVYLDGRTVDTNGTITLLR
nr:gliding motility-associated C-terminal domain-containing protein [Chitinophagales bacterium]